MRFLAGARVPRAPRETFADLVPRLIEALVHRTNSDERTLIWQMFFRITSHEAKIRSTFSHVVCPETSNVHSRRSKCP